MRPGIFDRPYPGFKVSLCLSLGGNDPKLKEANHNFGPSLLLRHFVAMWRSDDPPFDDLAIVFFKKHPSTAAPGDGIAVRVKSARNEPAAEDEVQLVTTGDDGVGRIGLDLLKIASSPLPMPLQRHRWTYAVLIGLAIVAGLASRSSLAEHLPALLAEYAGDTLWALTLFLVLGFTFPSARTVIVALATVSIAFAVEFSQLYQAEWITAVREIRIGALLLGHGFLWSDLLCYLVGTVLGAIGETLWQRIRTAGREAA